MSQKAFINFFKQEEESFPRLREYFKILNCKNDEGKEYEVCPFYKHIRCSILHQAETTGGYRIVRDKSNLFDENQIGKSIEADKFLDAMSKCLDKYLAKLKLSSIDSDVWQKAMKKVAFICDNCRA
jgi:hypothetical protein